MKENQEYQPYDYVACFENAFEDGAFEQIPFATMDFRERVSSLRKLNDKLDRYYETVTYPIADDDELVPNIVGHPQWTEGLGFDYIVFLYTPPIWYEEARKALLFAHKICFEDPLPQMIQPIIDNIDKHPYTQGAYKVIPSQVHSTHLELLRQILLNVQRMARLIRSGIIIPHSLLNNRIPDFSRGEYSTIVFPDETSHFAMEAFSQTLGSLIAISSLDNFDIPKYLLDRVKEIAPGEDGWQSVGFYEEVFNEIAVHDEDLDPHDPLRQWPRHMYYIALYSRYLERYGLGYSLHFDHPQGNTIYAILEAADLAHQSLTNLNPSIDKLSYARLLERDSVFVSKLQSSLRPNLNILTDDDLVSIRLEEELFENWRGVVRDSLKAVRNYENATGSQHSETVVKEVQERLSEWQDARSRRLRKSVMRGFFDVGAGTAIGVISSLMLGDPLSLASISIGGAWSILSSCGRIFSWRRKEELVNRHFLSVL